MNKFEKTFSLCLFYTMNVFLLQKILGECIFIWRYYALTSDVVDLGNVAWELKFWPVFALRSVSSLLYTSKQASPDQLE
jgi:hypothetical protein